MTTTPEALQDGQGSPQAAEGALRLHILSPATIADLRPAFEPLLGKLIAVHGFAGPDMLLDGIMRGALAALLVSRGDAPPQTLFLGAVIADPAGRTWLTVSFGIGPLARLQLVTPLFEELARERGHYGVELQIGTQHAAEAFGLGYREQGIRARKVTARMQ